MAPKAKVARGMRSLSARRTRKGRLSGGRTMLALNCPAKVDRARARWWRGEFAFAEPLTRGWFPRGSSRSAGLAASGLLTLQTAGWRGTVAGAETRSNCTACNRRCFNRCQEGPD